MGPLLRQLVLESLTQPKIAARRLLGVNLPKSERFQIAILVAILHTIASILLLNALEALREASVRPEVVSIPPILDAVFQFGLLYFFAFAIEKIGQMFDGKGNYDQSLLIVLLFTFVTSLWFLVMAAAFTLVPVLAVMLALAYVYWTFWALASFVVVLHGFQSVLNTLMGVIVFGMLVSLILLIVSGIILNTTGLGPTGTL